jgi:DNA-binding XRE family transcriptional regulator
MSSVEIDESIKAAIAIKTARAAAGLNQVDFAQMLGIAKTTLARIETLETQVKLDIYFKAVRVLSDHGVEIDSISSDDIVVKVSKKAQQAIVNNLADEAKRRSDRKKS